MLRDVGSWSERSRRLAPSVEIPVIPIIAEDMMDVTAIAIIVGANRRLA